MNIEIKLVQRPRRPVGQTSILLKNIDEPCIIINYY